MKSIGESDASTAPYRIRTLNKNQVPTGQRLLSLLRSGQSMKWIHAIVSLLAIAVSSLEAGEVTTFAGTGQKGFSGDGGPASKAQLNNPFAIARGPDGALYICDVNNHRVRRVATDGTI